MPIPTSIKFVLEISTAYSPTYGTSYKVAVVTQVATGKQLLHVDADMLSSLLYSNWQQLGMQKFCIGEIIKIEKRVTYREWQRLTKIAARENPVYDTNVVAHFM